MLVLHCCVGFFLVAGCRVLVVVASLVVEHRLNSWGARAFLLIFLDQGSNLHLLHWHRVVHKCTFCSEASIMKKSYFQARWNYFIFQGMKIRLCLCTLRTRDQTRVPCTGRQIFHAYFHSMKIRLCNRCWCFCVFLFSCGLWYHYSLHSVGYTFNSCWQVKWNLVLLTNECSQLFSFSTPS